MSPSREDPPPAPKIAIKGFSLSSKSSNGTLKPGAKSKPPPSSLGKRPRSTFHHDGSDSGSDSDNGSGGRNRRNGNHEVVTGFGEGGAIRVENGKGKGEDKGPLVIPKMGNRDWRGEMRAKRGGGKNLLPAEVQAAQKAVERERNGEGKMEGVDVVNSKDGEIQWGLSVRKKENRDTDPSQDSSSKAEGEETEQTQDTEEAKPQEPSKPKTADEEALEALLGQKKEKKGPDLIIPTISNQPEEKLSEEDAYRRAIASAPDVSTLEDYERVPVEEFGAALLRGMGWKGEKRGKVREVKRRQNLLGLGAKELKDAEELGAWVQKSDVKRLNERRGGASSGYGGGERRPKVSEYKREKERRDERREERGGGGYRRDRERDGYRERDRDRRR